MIIENDFRSGPAAVTIRPDGYIRLSARARRLIQGDQVVFILSADKREVTIAPADEGQIPFRINRRGVIRSAGLALTTGADGTYRAEAEPNVDGIAVDLSAQVGE